VAVLVLGWASRQHGGVEGTFQRAIDSVRNAVVDVTDNGNVSGAVKYLQHRYERDGRYPQLSESQLAEVRDADFTGVDYTWCAPEVAIVGSFTARGTVSRLLVRGGDWGTVPGAQGCPSTLLHPTPWTVPPTGPPR
jgi:hypothetical protein